MTGLVVCAAVLAAATVFGVVWRRRTGVLRVVRAGARNQTPAAGEAVGASGAGAPGPGAPDAHSNGNSAKASVAGKRAGVITAAQLGRPLGSRATLVQFSTAFCAPCRATRRILADVAGMVEGVVHVEVDAEANLGLVRSLGIHSTPAVFVLAADGTILRRGTGQPRKPDVIAALGSIAPGPDTPEDAAAAR